MRDATKFVGLVRESEAGCRGAFRYWRHVAKGASDRKNPLPVTNLRVVSQIC
jgi:hypothetical protein